jgi:hypothetical protein
VTRILGSRRPDNRAASTSNRADGGCSHLIVPDSVGRLLNGPSRVDRHTLQHASGINTDPASVREALRRVRATSNEDRLVGEAVTQFCARSAVMDEEVSTGGGADEVGVEVADGEVVDLLEVDPAVSGDDGRRDGQPRSGVGGCGGEGGGDEVLTGR